jgi:hypothetical protein
VHLRVQPPEQGQRAWLRERVRAVGGEAVGRRLHDSGKKKIAGFVQINCRMLQPITGAMHHTVAKTAEDLLHTESCVCEGDYCNSVSRKMTELRW